MAKFRQIGLVKAFEQFRANIDEVVGVQKSTHKRLREKGQEKDQEKKDKGKEGYKERAAKKLKLKRESESEDGGN